MLLVYEREVGRFQLRLDRLLAVASTEVITGISGCQAVVEPAYGLDATWIERDEQSHLETLGFTVVPPLSVLQTHLYAVVLEYIDLLLARENVLACLEGVRERNPGLYEATMRRVSVSHELLRALLRDRLSIKRIDLICEWITDHDYAASDAEHLATYIATRMASFDADIESRRTRLAGCYQRRS